MTSLNSQIDGEITPEMVQDLYEKYKNKQHFINVFGTKKFHLVDKDFLIRMHIFLNK